MLDLENQLTFHHIFDAFLTWALDHWSEGLATYCLVDFESTSIACVNSDLHAWLHVTTSGDNTFDSNHASNCIGLDVSHFDEILLGVLARSDLNMIAPLKFRWNAMVLTTITGLHETLLEHLCMCLSIVLSPLLH